jgi:hypothetical protein
MSTQTLLIWGVALFLGGFGVLCFVAKDWLWDRHEGQMRARGVVNLERTPEWENQQNLMGAGMIVVALVLVVVSAGLT